MSDIKVNFILAGRPANRGFFAFVNWIGAFVERLVPGRGNTPVSPDERSSYIKGWRAYWAAMDDVARRLTGR